MSSQSNKMQSNPSIQGPVCPVPLAHGDTIVMGHGSGGRMTHDLIQRVFMPHLNSAELLAGNDFAVLGLLADAGMQGSLAVSTDSHIVTPLFFPGGDIGKLAVCGTVNDVAMSGATPLFLTAGFIIEEGLPMQTLERVVASMQLSGGRSRGCFRRRGYQSRRKRQSRWVVHQHHRDWVAPGRTQDRW